MKRGTRLAVLGVVVAAHVGAMSALTVLGASSPAPAIQPPVLVAEIVAEPEPQPTPPQPPQPPVPVPQPQPKPQPKPVPKKVEAKPVAETPSVPKPASESMAAPSDPQPVAAVAPAPGPSVPPPPPVREPAAVSCRAPAYPSEAKRRGETGVVLLRLLIDTDGAVTDHRIEQSSGSELLDQAAVTALSKCRFRPGTVDGRPQAAWAKLRYVWKLE